MVLLVGGRSTNNGRSVVSISDGPGRLFNHGPRGTGPLYHHWTVSRANCGYISLSLQPARCNDWPVCCTTSAETQRHGWERRYGNTVTANKQGGGGEREAKLLLGSLFFYQLCSTISVYYEVWRGWYSDNSRSYVIGILPGAPHHQAYRRGLLGGGQLTSPMDVSLPPPLFWNTRSF